MNIFSKLKLFDHLGLKLVALVLAFLAWLIVMNIDDYKVTRNFSNIKVEQKNGAIYNVAGQKVNAGYKGLIIMNGNKFVNK